MTLMLKGAQIPFEFEENIENYSIIIERGYIGFVSILTFDKNGMLKDIGAWE